MLFSRQVSRVRKGYSLIELVVVLMILAIVAGLTVSLVDWLRRSADKAAASNIMGSLLSNVQLYRTTIGLYPDQFDSLTDPTGTALYAKLHDELRTERLTLDTAGLSTGELRSLTRVGITTVMDHDAAAEFPGNSGLKLRLLAASSKLALITQGEVINSIYPPAGDTAVSGSGLPTGVKLVALGFGPMNKAVGKTIVAPPMYSGVGDPSQLYARFVCVFAVFNDGSAAQIKGVLDSKGDFLNEELTEFYQNTPK